MGFIFQYHFDSDPEEYDERNVRSSRDFLREMKKIDKMLDRSICYSPSCGRSDRGMILNPITRVWFFILCYQRNHEFYRYNSKYSHQFP